MNVGEPPEAVGTARTSRPVKAVLESSMPNETTEAKSNVFYAIKRQTITKYERPLPDPRGNTVNVFDKTGTLHRIDCIATKSGRSRDVALLYGNPEEPCVVVRNNGHYHDIGNVIGHEFRVRIK